MTRLRPIQPELPLGQPTPRPRQITTNSSAELFAVCDRETKGEIIIEAVSVGKGNGQWIFQVRYET